MLDDTAHEYRAKLQKIVKKAAYSDETLNSVTERVAAILSEQLDPHRNWTPAYIKQLLNGKQKCSRFIQTAIDRYLHKKRPPNRSGQVIYCGTMSAAQRRAVIEKLSPDQRTQVLLEAVESEE